MREVEGEVTDPEADNSELSYYMDSDELTNNMSELES